MAAPTLWYTTLTTPLGTLYIAKSLEGVCRVGLEEPHFLRDLERKFWRTPILARSSFSELIDLLNSYFRGEKIEFSLPLDLRGLTHFHRRVLLEVRKIPYGKLKTYGEIAQLIGQPKASRAVGQALSKNPLLILIPCHRVISKKDGLGGFGYGSAVKEKLLRLENAWPL